MKLKNLFLSFLLLIPSITYSAEVFEVDGIYYQPNEDGTCSVTAAPNNGYHFFTDIEIPPQVADLEGNIFIVTAIGKFAFERYENLKSVSLPTTITSIEYGAFFICPNLEFINLPEGLSYLGKFAFSNCYKLSITELPSTLTQIDYSSFCFCHSVSIRKIPSNVKNIGGQAFESCENISSIEFEGIIESIGEKAFYDIPLQYVKFLKDYVPECSYDAFSNETYANAPLYVPEDALENFKTTAPWSQFTTIRSLSSFTIEPTITPNNTTDLYQIPDVEVNWSTYDFSFNEEANKYPTLSYGNITIDLSDYCSKSVVTSSVSTPWGSSSSTFCILKISLSKLSLTAPGEYVLNIPDKYVYIEQADIYNDEISEVFTVKGGDDSYLPSNFNATPADGSILTELNEIKIDWNDTSLYEGMVGVSNIAVYVNGENNELINNEKFYVSNDILNLILPSLERKVGNIEIIIKEGTILSKSGKTNKEIKLTYKLVSPATGIMLNIEEAELELNQTLQLEVTVLPENEKHMPILWSTSNTNVATVSDNGLVKAVSLGVTTITATCGEISAECEITVIEDAGIESLFLDSENMIDIYSPTGILIKKNTKLEDLKFWDKGIYILKSKGKSYKVNLK